MKYIVLAERKDGCGDIFTKLFDTPEQANAEASAQWHHLTPSEQSARHIYAGAVEEDSGWIIPDNDNCDIYTFAGAFDSLVFSAIANPGRYDYEALKAAALAGIDGAVNALGTWFDRFGTQFWNGEYYDAEQLHIKPVYEENDGDFEVIGYEMI